jgi:hypothetical protein
VRGRAKKHAIMLAFIDPETLIPADHPLRTIKRVADTALLELSPRSTTDPDARLCRKGPGKEARLSYMGQALMENRHGLLVDFPDHHRHWHG